MPPAIMPYNTWMELTKTNSPRSSELRAIDAALENYHRNSSETNLSILKLALHRWKMSKGFDEASGWVTSERNGRQAVERLDLQLFGIDSTLAQCENLAVLAELPFYGIELWAETEAKMYLKAARESCLHDLFVGKEVVFKQLKLIKAARRIRKQLSKAMSKAIEAGNVLASPAFAAAAQATAPARAAVSDARDRAMAPVHQALAPIREAREHAMAPVNSAMAAAEDAAKQLIEEILSQFPARVAEEALRLIMELVPNFMTDLAASIAPYISLAPGSVKVVTNSFKALKQEYTWIETKYHIEAGAIRSGDPAIAANCILRLIERKRNNAGRLAALYSTDVSVKAAGIAADAASWGVPSVSAIVTPLQGAATALARLSLTVYAFARDVYEKYVANKMLRRAHGIRLTSKLFDECPLLGCYFISCSTTSDIINFLVEDMGTPGWNLDVERMANDHIYPLLLTSRNYIYDHPLEVRGLEGHKWRFKPLKPKKLKKKLESASTGNMTGFGKSPQNPFLTPATL